ncbi:hypothetical protein HPB47_006181 [Ixodes persulcatus]|uniref:Uncharacterized protein n=1 Tax=Ixodes persulcatus TaxID=34615 RepID=A0AC60PBI8_IXOPE|nr:hypothetical protein HPB47_006181 [Ixodes persulcatus]
MSSSEKVVNIGDHLSSDITPGQRPPVNPMEDSPAATPNASYEYSNIEHSDMEQDNDSGGQWCISGNRKRVRSDDSLSDSGTARVSNPVSNSLTVVYAPTDSEKKLTSLSSLKVTQALETISPECILQVRYNQRLNLIAVDVRNGHAAQVLMNNTFLCGIQVRPYSPLSGKTSIGVIHDVDAEVTDEELAQHLRSEAKIANARRLGKSRVVKVVFSGSHLPSHVLLGHVRHSVVPFKEKPIQCHNCGGFGHKKIACKRAQACNRCAENHVPTAEGCIGRQIETTAAAFNLRALNDGSATFCRRHTKASTLDITLVSPEIDALWTVEPDTGGIARSITFDRLEEAYGDWIHVYTDASVSAVKKTATVAITIPEIDFEVSGRLNFETSSTTAELVAIWAALESIKNITPPTKAVVPTDSRGALQQLRRLERATPLLNRVALTAATVEDLGWSLALQWIPSHVGIPGNERADELAARAHNDGDPTFLLDRFNEAHRLIRDTIRKKHPHTGVATGRPPPSIPRKLPRSEASLLHRLRTGCPHTAKRLHMYRRKTDPGCPTCGDPEDTTHALLLCPTHEDLRKVLLRSYAAVGLPHSTAQELLNPSGTRGIVEKAFRALLQYLRDSELSDRL